MKSFATIVVAAIFLAHAPRMRAQEEQPVQPTEVVQSVQDFLHDNLDLTVLGEVQIDPERIQQLLAQLNTGLQDTNVFKLISLRQTATNLLPVLQRFEETLPYADWLSSRLDFFTMLDDLQREIGLPGDFSGGRLPNPPPEIERKVWNGALEKRPVPARAATLVPVLKPIFSSEQIPPELVWLAEVESSFNPSARSPVGALGLFQLMPATAKDLDLSLRPQDERLLPEKSARAAATYLRQLHERFNDWRLALAAYNAGQGRVSRLLKSNKAETFDAIASQLPAETQMYVPKVEATILKREGVSLTNLKLREH